jgi:hypothetical protein
LAGDASILLRYWARDHEKIGFDVDLSGGDGGEMFKAALKAIVLKKLNAPYRSGPSKT